MDAEEARQVSSLTRLLLALEYPRAQQFALAEDRKIRLYDIDERASLRKPGPQWSAAFQKYLKDVGCPHDWSDTSRTDQVKALRWLLSKALSCEYMDAAEQYNEAAAVSSAAKADAGALPPPPSGGTGLLHDDYAVGVEALAAKVGVDAGGRDTRSNLEAILSAVQTKLSVAAMDAVKEGTAQRLQLDDFPLSYTTGDELVDRVARALTLLYVTDLREVQNDINDILVSAQEFTANPKTNTALGKTVVGDQGACHMLERAYRCMISPQAELLKASLPRQPIYVPGYDVWGIKSRKT